MYVPQIFEEKSIPVLHKRMRAHPLATLITLQSTGLVATHIPMVLHAEWPNSAPLAEPWQVSDAPREFIEAQVRAIVGIESQNRSQRDCQGVSEGLTDLNTEDSLAMKALVEER